MENKTKRSCHDEVINDLLGYDGLKIIQRPDTFNFSLDSTILAYFVTLNSSTKKIMDLGCGNGYIPIFLTLRTKAKIYGVEIQKNIYNLAEKSVLLNHLESQITLFCDDMKKIHEQVGVCQFDVVTSNPPFFPVDEKSIKNETMAFTIARHEVAINLDQVLETSNRLLKDGGRLAMVHRTNRLLDVLRSFHDHQIEPCRLMFVYPKKSSQESLMFFIEGRKTTNRGNLKVLPPLYVKNEDDTYTKEILTIFNYKPEVEKC
jgi:tRNA1Val (adenine37-N6)-methyltransferase